MSWRQDNTGITAGGDVGGDYQATDSFSVRYVHTDRSAVVTVYAYGVERRPGRYSVEMQTEMTVCRDVRRPGDTEEWSDSAYAAARGTFNSAEQAYRAAHDAIRRHKAREIRWDGRAPWEKGTK
ncbi:hypothetical protein ACGFNU_21045 [Spirillospora sp. NPDC048911]|uniref:hypothetical protein n=1 Tax=Spirillospora sp. NPDC048911 TaxID=3364527 RepID=UPI003714E28C